MRRTAPATLAATLLVVAALAACSDDSDGPSGSSTPPVVSSTSSASSATTEPSTSVSSTSSPAEADLRAPCAGLTSEDLQSIFGVEFGLPDDSTGAISTVDDFDYKTIGCDFESSDKHITVDLDLSFAEQFDDGVVHCVEPSDHMHPVVPVADLGKDAWWQDTVFANSTDAEGELTVCLDAVLIRVVVEGPGTLRSTVQQQAIGVARIVVG
jgi:hypothetical protein